MRRPTATGTGVGAYRLEDRVVREQGQQGDTANAKRTAGRIEAESEGAQREREIAELEQQFDEPPHERPGGQGSPQADHARAKTAFGAAIESVKGILDDSQLGAVLKPAVNSLNDDMLVAKFCYDLAGETGGETSGWFARLAEALEEQDRTREEFYSTGRRPPNRLGPEARLAARLIAAEGRTDPGNEVGNWPGGWLNGEWKCPRCLTMIGRNLKGETPVALVRRHECE